MTVLALMGVKALYLLCLWLASAIAASWLSDRKGYGERPAWSSGSCSASWASWLVWPARPDSRWKLQGPPPRGGGARVAEARARSGQGGGA